jgi:acetyl esterase/lipase
MAPAPQPSALEKLSLLPKVSGAVGAVSYALVTRPFTSETRPKDAFRDAFFSAMRGLLSNISTPLEQWSNSSTEAEYVTFTKAKKLPPTTDVLESGLRVHWIGDKTERKTILFLHGGGYNLAASAGHLQWLGGLRDSLAKQTSLNILLPSYTLAPEAQYPTQLKQAVETLQWLVEKQGKSPNDVDILHDSSCMRLLME